MKLLYDTIWIWIFIYMWCDAIVLKNNFNTLVIVIAYDLFGGNVVDVTGWIVFWEWDVSHGISVKRFSDGAICQQE